MVVKIIGRCRRVQALDLGTPRPRAPMGQLGEIRERRRAEIEEMLALQVATGALAAECRRARARNVAELRVLGPPVLRPKNTARCAVTRSNTQCRVLVAI